MLTRAAEAAAASFEISVVLMKRLIFVSLILPLLIACPKAKEQEKKAEQIQQRPSAQVMQTAPYWFAVADGSGKRLRYLGTSQSTALENPATFTNAVCSGGPLLTIKYTGQKEAAPDSTYRDTVDNFDKMGGHYYEIVNSKTESDDICLMTDAGFYNDRKRLASSTFLEKLSPDTKARIEKAKNRKVKDSWGLFGTEDGRQLFLVLFERSGNDALAGIVMVSPAKLVFLDFKGSYKDETSVWRVSDGGELDSLMFDILYAFQGKNGLEFVYGWKAPEGESIALMQESGSQFVQLADSYRYYY